MSMRTPTNLIHGPENDTHEVFIATNTLGQLQKIKRTLREAIRGSVLNIPAAEDEELPYSVLVTCAQTYTVEKITALLSEQGYSEVQIMLEADIAITA